MSIPSHSPYDRAHCPACAAMADTEDLKRVGTTRAHRATAFACTWSDAPRKIELEWIETGEYDQAAGQRCVRTAKALAELEARVTAPLLAEIERLRAERKGG